MTIICIEQAEEGMIIGKDVTNSNKKLLVKKETVLTSGLIKALNSHGINEIFICPQNKTKKSFSEENILQAMEICRETVAERFFELSFHPMMKLIFDTAIEIEAQKHLLCNKQN